MDEKEKAMTHEEWLKEGERRFGPNAHDWRFVCPSCGHVASVGDWKKAGAPEAAVAFSCVGRWDGHINHDAFQKDGGPCNYAGGGLICLNPVEVDHDGKIHRVFAFAEAT